MRMSQISNEKEGRGQEHLSQSPEKTEKYEVEECCELVVGNK